MKLFKLLFATILVSGLFIGCTSSLPSPSDVSVKKGKGAIIVYRPHNNIWRHKRFNIYINDKYEDMLRNKSNYIFNAVPGKYVIELREDVDIKPESHKVEIQLNEGKVKYVRLGTNSVESHLKLKKVRKAIAVSDEWDKKRY